MSGYEKVNVMKFTNSRFDGLTFFIQAKYVIDIKLILLV